MTDKIENALAITLSWVARFNRHKFFTKELYKKIPGYKNLARREKTEILLAFVFYNLRNVGIYATPCGISFCKVWDDSTEVDNYLEPYQPIIDGYVKWCEEQNKRG